MSLEAGLRKLKEKADAASPGPRQIRTDEGSSLYDVVWQRGTYLCMSVLKEDAEFIAACSPETVRALVDVAEAAVCRRFTMTPCRERPEIPPADYCPTCAALARLEGLLGEED